VLVSILTNLAILEEETSSGPRSQEEDLKVMDESEIELGVKISSEAGIYVCGGQ
jgi:hypothetical protein